MQTQRSGFGATSDPPANSNCLPIGDFYKPLQAARHTCAHSCCVIRAFLQKLSRRHQKNYWMIFALAFVLQSNRQCKPE